MIRQILINKSNVSVIPPFHRQLPLESIYKNGIFTRSAARTKSLQYGDKFVTISLMRDTRLISWVKAARKEFEEFPEDVQSDIFDALTVAAEGGKSDKAKPFRGVDGGVFEIALRYRGDAFRALYAVKIGADIWVIHAFQKKSKSGIKTPQMEVDLIRERLKRLKEALK
jgi:phage-related protein